MRIPLSKWQVLWLGVILVSAGGCCKNRIHVRATGYENVNLLVDLVGVSPSEKILMDWDNVTNQEYWEPGSKWFAAAEEHRERIRFYNNPKADTGAMLYRVEKNHPIWKTWKKLKDTYLYVFAQPGFNSKTALRVPLRCKCWTGKVIEIDISKEGIRPTTLKDKCLKELGPCQ